MTRSRKKYVVNVSRDNDGHSDDWRTGEIYPENITTPNNFYMSKLWIIDHYFREQRSKQDRKRVGFVADWDEREYDIDHFVTLDEQVEYFGYTHPRNQNGFAMFIDEEDGTTRVVKDIDLIDKEGNYITTYREERKEGDGKYSTYTRNDLNPGDKYKPHNENYTTKEHFETYPIDDN